MGTTKKRWLSLGIPCLALGALAATMVALERRETPAPAPVGAMDSTTTQNPRRLPDPEESDRPESPDERAAADLGVVDRAILASYCAKRDAQKFVHTFNSALRIGAADLSSVTDPAVALRKLMDGVPGPGELVFQFKKLTPTEAEALTALIAFEGDRMRLLPEGEFTTLEAEISRRAKSCQYGACGDCVQHGLNRLGLVQR